MRFPSTTTLVNIAIGGGFASILGASYFQHKIQSTFKEQEYYKKSLEILDNNEEAIRLLGPPIQLKYLHLWDGSTRSTGLEAHLKIPLKGKLQRGALYVWASRETPSDSWNIDRLDIEIGKSKPQTFYPSFNYENIK